MNIRQAPYLSVVIPVFNEVESIQPLHDELVRVLDTLGKSYEIIYVDDGSADGTFDALTKLVPATVIRFARNFGKSQALQAGFDRAEGTYIVTMDGDLQDDPAEIAQMIEKAQEGVDLVCGWKKHRKDPLSKRLPSKVANAAARFMTGTNVHDMNCCLKLYRKEVAKNITLHGDMHRYIPSLVHSLGYSVDEVIVNHRARQYGETKYGIGRLASSLFDFATLIFLRKFVDRPMHFFGALGLFLSGVGVLVLCYMVYLKLVLGELIGDRPLLLMGVLFAIVGIQMLSLGLIGELIIRQRADTRRFVIRDVVDSHA